MSRRWAQILFSIASLTVVGHSQNTASKVADMLPDEDGGQVRVVLPGSNGTMSMPGQTAATRSPKQVSIFFGAEWAQQANRLREGQLINLLAGASEPQLTEMTKSGVRATNAQGAFIEDFTDLSARGTLTDLSLQRQLSQWISGGALKRPSSNTVYVVYLGPGANSSLRGKVGGQDYLGYYSLLHLDGGDVIYVVVPYDADTQRLQRTATQLLIEAAIDPSAKKR
jgi:hypothetical protein